MTAPRHIAFFVFPEFQSLDLTGPLEVFACASWSIEEAGRAPAYRTTVVAERAGAVRAASGLEVVAHRGIDDDLGDVDTLVVVGGPGIARAATDSGAVRFVRDLASRSRRVASVCTGAFLLGAAGLLDGRKAATHWQYAEMLAQAFPAALLDGDAVYTKDGPVYTSAGVTAGMDLALALVESDHGRATSMHVARYLVMYVHRAGGQSQRSPQLTEQSAEALPVDDTKTYVLENVRADLSVAALAARVAMSPRNFARVFKRKVGRTPAQFVEQARLDAARRLLEQTTCSVDEISRASGFGLPETLRRAFVRELGVSPGEYRKSCALRGG